MSKKKGKRYLTPEDILSWKDRTEDVEIERGVYVTIRPLTGKMMAKVRNAAKISSEEDPRHTFDEWVNLWQIKYALVNPKLSIEQVEELFFYKQVQLVWMINRISGMSDELANLLRIPLEARTE